MNRTGIAEIDRFAADEPAEGAERGSSSSDPDALVRILPPPSNPMAVARIFAATELTHIDGLTLRYWRGSWWEWTGPHWRELHPRHIRGRLYRFAEHAVYGSGDKSNPWAPTQRKVADLLEALGAVCFLPDAVEAPAWLDRRNSGLVVACANGLLDIENRRLAEHTPLFFNVVSTTVDFLADAKSPTRWLGFLDALWPGMERGERERAECAVLGEWFGYVLSGRTDVHRILLMVGPTRGGKGVIARVLATLVGKGNVAGPTLSSLAGEFGLAPLIGKPLAIISDARMGKTNNNIVVERLLSISGEDMLTINVKYREQWTGRLPTRLHVVSNELPRLGDASAAIIGRFLVLLATESWLGREDLTLEPALHEERSGILSWALDGLTRLAQNGWRFTPNPAADDAIVQLRDLAAPVAAFVRDRCVLDSDAEVEIGTLYSDWRTWCDNNGQVKTTRQTFGRDLKAAYPMIKVKQPRDGNERHRVYAGIGLRLAGA